MSAIITLPERILSSKSFINSNFDYLIDDNYTYFYTGRTMPWDDESLPDVSTSDYKDTEKTKRTRIFMKKLDLSNVSLAIKKYTWATGTIFSRCDCDKEYTDVRSWISPESPFYCINSEGNVYKCISNNYDGPSTIEPTGKSLTYSYLGDGYIWKFMYDMTIDISSKFLSDTWIPAPYGSYKSFTQISVETSAVNGDIPYIHVTNSGTGYTSTPTVTITGDGTGAVATAIMEGNIVKTISLSNKGTGYTYADVTIYGNGVDASAVAMISPSGGHGKDAVEELGAFYVAVEAEIISDEDTIAPITGTYRNIGLVKNTKTKLDAVITSSKVNTLSNIRVNSCSGTFLHNEKIIGQTSRASGIIYYDPTGVNKTIDVYMIAGIFTNGESIYGQTSGIFGTYSLSGSINNTIDIKSGTILYKENIKLITRREIQTEKFLFTIEF